MPRFFTEEVFSDSPAPETILLSGDNAYHLIRVLRARAGESVTVVSGNGREYRCGFLEGQGEKGALKALLKVISVEERPEKLCRVTLLQGMPKGKKVDLILQKATELGADRIALVYMDRSVPVEKGSGEGKLARFRRIVEEAASQSGRGDVPELLILPDLEHAVDLLREQEIAFACYEAERQRSLSQCLRSDARSIGFLIGPEGGISGKEIGILEAAGIPTVSLGKRILRTETAPLAVLSMILYVTELNS